MPLQGSSTQLPPWQVWPLPQATPMQASAWQVPSRQRWVGLQLLPAQGSATQVPSMSHRSAAPQVTKAQACTQSWPTGEAGLRRQKVAAGQAAPLQASSTQAPCWQTWPPGQPVA